VVVSSILVIRLDIWVLSASQTKIGRPFGTPELKMIQKSKKEIRGNTIVMSRYKGLVVILNNSLENTFLKPDAVSSKTASFKGASFKIMIPIIL
jgi:hypothetical protein